MDIWMSLCVIPASALPAVVRHLPSGSRSQLMAHRATITVSIRLSARMADSLPSSQGQRTWFRTTQRAAYQRFLFEIHVAGRLLRVLQPRFASVLRTMAAKETDSLILLHRSIA